MYKMVIKPILGYFLLKRKTRVFPYFIGLYELFTTTLFIFFTTATETLKTYSHLFKGALNETMDVINNLKK